MESWLENWISPGLILMLLLPAGLVLSGLYERFGHTENPNFSLGYRTGRSMKSREAWKAANRLSGKLRIRAGCLCFLGVAVIGPLLASSQTGIALVLLFEWILWHLLYIPVERMLREREKNGKDNT